MHAEASGWSDLLAERVAQLGGVADGTSGTVTEISRAADKMLWFLEAHLQGEAAA